MTGPALPEGLAAALGAAGLEPAVPLGPAPGGARWVARDRGGLRWVVTVVETSAVRSAAAVRARAGRLSEIDHPHLPRVGPVLDLGRDGLAVLHQEVPGTDLATVRAGRGAWAPGEVVTIVVPLAEALATLHAAGLAHGDVAAANVVLTPEGRAVLVDLVCGDAQDEFGTPGVAAPERPHGARPAGDVHALARLGLQLLVRPAGPPHEDGHLPEPLDLDLAASARLAACLTAATVHDPDQRPDAAALAAAVYATCRPAPVTVPDPAVLAPLAMRRAASAPGDGTERTQRTPPRPVRAVRGRHRRRRPQGWLIAGWAALATTVCAVAVAGMSAHGRADQATQSTRRPVDPVTAAVRLTLDRAEALITGDLAALAAVTVPGSPARSADLDALRGLGERGASAGPVRMAIGSVARLPGGHHSPACGTARPATGTAGPATGTAGPATGTAGPATGTAGPATGTAHGLGCARVRIVVRVRTGTVADGPGTGAVTDPADVPGVVLVLRAAPDGWRVSEVAEAP